MAIIAFICALTWTALTVRCHYVNETYTEHDYYLEIINRSLAMNDRWSAVFSETLNANAFEHPDETFCERVVPVDANIIDTFQAVRTIASKCSHTGMYVKYGVKLLQHSATCFFYRVAVVHLSVTKAVTKTVTDSGPNERFETMLGRLVVDYEVIVDKLAALDAPLDVALKLVVLFEETRTSLPKLSHAAADVQKSLKKDLKHSIKTVSNMVQKEFNRTCAVGLETDWWDNHTNDKIVMAKVKDKTNLDNALDRADQLRELMLRVFGKLTVDKLLPDMWPMIFDYYLLNTHDKMLKVDEARNATETVIQINDDDEEEETYDDL